MARRLSLIAGSGALVPMLVAAARDAGDTLQILSLLPRDAIDGVAVTRADIGNPQAIIAAIRTFGATHVALCGGIDISDSARAGIAEALGGSGPSGTIGDVGLAGLVAALARLTGASLIGAHEIAPSIVATEGPIAGPSATPAQLAAGQSAIGLAREVGRLDFGQAVVVSGARPIAAEDIAGTDALLMRIAMFRERGLTGDSATPLVLAKAAKPSQPLFADLPAIGPTTIVNAAAAGISAIAVEAGRTLLLDRAGIEAAASQHGVAVFGLAVDG